MVGRLGPEEQKEWQLGRSFELMRWLKRIGLAGVVFFTVKGLIWLGVALMALVLVGKGDKGGGNAFQCSFQGKERQCHGIGKQEGRRAKTKGHILHMSHRY